MQVLKVKENKPKLTTFSFKWDLLWLFIFKNFNSLPGKKEETLLEATPQKKFHTYIHWVFSQKKEQKKKKPVTKNHVLPFTKHSLV